MYYGIININQERKISSEKILYISFSPHQKKNIKMIFSLDNNFFFQIINLLVELGTK